MADDEIRAELTERFGTPGKALEPDTEAELRSIMRLYDLSAEDMFYKWDAYCIKMNLNDAKATPQGLRAFKQNLQDALERSARTQANSKPEKRHGVGATPRTATKNSSDVFNMLDSLTTPSAGRASKLASARRRQMDTPSISRIKGEPASSPLKMKLEDMGAIPPSSFHDRKNPGEVIETLNSHLPAADPPIAPFGEPRLKATAASDQKKLGYKTLAMKISEASEILDDRIEEFGKLILEYHGLEESAFGNAVRQGTTEIVAMGRITSDSAEGRLNAASLVLETTRTMGNSIRVPLDLTQLKGYQFFPGQIVALRGSNASGREFTVKEVLEVPLYPSAASTPSVLEGHRDRLRGGPDAMDSDSDPLPATFLFASGPYTTDDNLDFEPLHALCARAADTYADALILAGPFLDSEHPMIASGDFDLPEDMPYDPDTATMDTVFRHLISPALVRLVAANPHITILLVPSVRDVVDKHAAWPQEAISRKGLGLPKSVRLVGNPVTLSLNDMVLGVSTQDVLFDLRLEELVGGRPAEPSLLRRVSRYLLEQRHYFPVFPPTARSRLPKTGTATGAPPGAMLDVSYLKLGEMVNRPDVLVVPSALPPFANVVESVVVINPGSLSKRRGAGTYAKMTLYPPDLKQEPVNGLLAHKIFERARVEIIKI